MKHFVDKLDNGLTVIRVGIPGVKSATGLILSATGSRYEKPEQYGIAHFFEHMVFKGTKKYPTAAIVSERIDGIGADFNAFTGSEYTGYYIKCASGKLDLVLDMLSEMVTAPMLRQDDIDREKGVIIEELNMYLDLPHARVGEIFEEMALKGSTLDHPIIGKKETIQAMTSADFESFLNEWYDFSNLTLVIAGENEVVSSPKMLELVSQYFTNTSGRNTNLEHKMYLENDFQYSGKVVFEEMQIEQAHFVLGWPSKSLDSKSQFASTLLSVMMGGNMSSRLFSEIREQRGLCYYISSGDNNYKDCGLFTAQAGVNLDKVGEAVKATRDEFVKIFDDKKFSEEELNRAKEYVVGKQTLALEDSRSVAQAYGLRQVLLGEILSPEEKIAKLKKVTLEEVNDLAKELFESKAPKLAVVGKLTEKQRQELTDIIS
ncbi:MAG: insulinase family protein [Pseudomonadales bacterium]|jgi:predicted Zn-dependent peptidase|nr:insulinase family protein [Pseudomonadales bacterium]